MNQREKVEQRYLEFLQDLKSVLELTSNVSIHKIMIKHKVSKTSSVTLLEAGIISKVGTKGSAVKWYWTSEVIPNLKMAAMVTDQNAAYIKRMAEAKALKELKVEPITVKQSELPFEDVEKVEKNQGVEVSIFWGLFKYKK